MKSVPPLPRMAWVAFGGFTLLILLFLFILPRPSDSAVQGNVDMERRSNAPDRFALLPSSDMRPSRTLESYSRLAHRNLFHPLVKPHDDLMASNGSLGLLPQGITGLPALGDGLFSLPGNDAAERVKSLGPWTYVGFSTVDGAPTAILENKTAHEGKTVQVGDQIEGAFVSQISRDRVRLEKSGKPLSLVLPDVMETIKSAGTAPPSGDKNKSGGPPAAPGTPPSNGSPTPPPVNAAPNGGPPPSGPPPTPTPPGAVKTDIPAAAPLLSGAIKG